MSEISDILNFFFAKYVAIYTFCGKFQNSGNLIGEKTFDIFHIFDTHFNARDVFRRKFQRKKIILVVNIPNLITKV